MTMSKQDELIFYFPSLEQLTLHLNPGTASLFCYQWNRILKEVGFWSSTGRQENIDQLKDGYFWHSLIKELLDDSRCTISQISEETGAPPDFIYKIYWDKPNRIYMPLSIGEKLLHLHQKIRPDLQQTQEEKS